MFTISAEFWTTVPIASFKWRAKLFAIVFYFDQLRNEKQAPFQDLILVHLAKVYIRK